MDGSYSVAYRPGYRRYVGGLAVVVVDPDELSRRLCHCYQRFGKGSIDAEQRSCARFYHRKLLFRVPLRTHETLQLTNSNFRSSLYRSSVSLRG